MVTSYRQLQESLLSYGCQLLIGSASSSKYNQSGNGVFLCIVSYQSSGWLVDAKDVCQYKLMKVANSRNLICPDIAVDPQTSPQFACASFSTFALQSHCTTRMSDFGVWLLFPRVADRNDRPHCHHVQMLMHNPV